MANKEFAFFHFGFEDTGGSQIGGQFPLYDRGHIAEVYNSGFRDRALASGKASLITLFDPIASRAFTRAPTVGGTADAVTITTTLGLTSLPAGLRLQLRLPLTNTGAMTINVDGLGAVDAKTPTLIDPPAGFIRTGFDHVIEYDGTRWIVFRLVQNIVNSNGRAVLFEDGTQICTHRFTVSLSVDNAYGNVFRSGGWSATFPAAFSAIPSVSVAEGGSDSGWVNAYNLSTTGLSFRSFDGISRATDDVTYSYTAIGRWF